MDNITKIVKAIQKIKSDAQFSLSGEDLDTLTWENGETPISKSDIEAKMVEVQDEYDAKKYQRDRAEEYPSIVDQLDDIYHNGIDGWKATIKVTKDRTQREG